MKDSNILIKDQTVINELFNVINDESGVMWLRYKEYCRVLMDKGNP